MFKEHVDIQPNTSSTARPSRSEMFQSIVNHIPTKRSASSKHSRIPKFHRHALDPFVVLFNWSAKSNPL
jgi:hypothetical protein